MLNAVMNIITNLFKGRINRRENFNKGVLAGLIGLGLILIINTIFNKPTLLTLDLTTVHGFLIFFVSALIAFYTFSLDVRRLHDLGKPGYFALIMVIPWASYMGFKALDQYIYFIIFVFTLYLFLFKGENKTNKYGNVTAKASSIFKTNNSILEKLIKGIKFILYLIIAIAVILLLLGIGVLIIRPFTNPMA